MSELAIHTLGKLQVKHDGIFIEDKLPLKGRALLVYLAVAGQAHTRETIAGLLWSNMPDESARTNLRVTLSKLRKLLGTSLQVSREMIRLADDVWVDTQLLTELAEKGEGRTAVSHYHGDFLANFYLPDTPLFDEWILIERERWRNKTLNLLHQLVVYAIEQPQYTEQGIADAKHILALDEWREEAHRQLMMLLARAGQRSAALAQFERCREILAEALGVEPSTATVELYETIKKEGQSLIVPVAHITPHNLPAATTPFVGRDVELAEIETLLAKEPCRLLTLTGPGGMGKTRLALQVAKQQLETGTFSDGVFFVPLAAVTKSEFLVTTIAQAIHVPLSGRQSPQEQLLNFLRQKCLLLLLDNFEQLLSQADLIAELLEAAPRLTLLITSRAPVDLYEEWVFEVGGLPVPQADRPDWEQSGSVRLFQRRAQRSHARFDLIAEKTAVIRICQLVQGMPLGIELAAVWVRTLSCSQIVAEIERNLDFLETTSRNVPERHRSLRATFAYSWQLLPEPAQQILQQLTVFNGGFTRDAAEAVAGASLRHISLLVDKSFLWRETNGRYHIHELLRQFASETADLLPIQQKQATYFAELIQLEVNEAMTQERLTAVLADIDNVRTAWQWGLSTQNIAIITTMLEGLYRFYMTNGWHQEGANQFAETVGQFSENTSLLCQLKVRQGHCAQLISPDLATLKQLFHEGYELAVAQEMLVEQAMALNGRGFTSLMQSQFDVADSDLQQSAQLAKEADATHVLGNSLNLLASLRRRQGQFVEAKAVCEEGLAVRRKTNDESGLASSLTNLGSIFCSMERYEEAQLVFEDALARCQQLNHAVGIANSLTGLFQTAYYLDNLEQATIYGEESLAHYRLAGDRWGMAIALHNLGFLAAKQTDFQEAKNSFSEAITLYRQLGIKSNLANTLKSLGVTYLDLGDVETAVSHFTESLQLSHESNVPYLMLEVLLEIARLWLQQQRHDEAMPLIYFIHQAEAARERTRVEAKALVDEFEGEFERWEMERPLTEIVTHILQLLAQS